MPNTLTRKTGFALIGLCLGTIPFAQSVAATSYRYQVQYPGLVATGGNAVTPTNTATLSVAPSSVAFGQIAPGTTATRSVTVSNPGTTQATGVAVALTGAGFALGQSCPTALAASASCTVTVSYTASSVSAAAASGSLSITASNASSTSLAVSGAPQPASLTLTPGVLSFGAAAVGTSATAQRVTVTNNSLVFGADITTLGIFSGQANFGQANTCGSTILPQQSCAVNVSMTPSVTGPLSGMLTVEHSGIVDTVSLTGSATAAGPVAEWSSSGNSLVALTAADFAMGTTGVGAFASKSFYVRNTGTSGAMSVGYVMTGDTSQFQVASVDLLYPSNGTGGYGCLNGGAITQGGMTSCLGYDVATSGPSEMRMTVQYRPKSAGNHIFTLTPITDNGTVLPGAITFTGTAVMDATAVWSSAQSPTVALTSTDTAYGPRVTNTTGIKTLYLRNTGSSSLAVGFTLTGDTSQYSISRVVRTYDTALYTNTFGCASGGTVAADGLSASPCVSGPVSDGAPTIVLSIAYKPTVIANHSITITPNTSNGTTLPGAIVLTGSGTGPVAASSTAWSSTYYGSTVALVPADLTLGTVTTGTTGYGKSLFITNTGSRGNQATGFTLSGDTTQFKLSAATLWSFDASSVRVPCLSGGVSAADNLSISPCVAAEVSGASPAANVGILLLYNPISSGNHSVTITPTTNNGTALPGAITVTATAAFNPVATWSMYGSSVVALTPTTLNFGSQAQNSITDHRLYALNTGGSGTLTMGFTLTGDTSQFNVSYVAKSNFNGNPDGGCTSGTGTAASPCVAPLNMNIFADVQFKPTASGSYSVTLTPTTTNGTGLPAALTFTGTSP